VGETTPPGLYFWRVCLNEYSKDWVARRVRACIKTSEQAHKYRVLVKRSDVQNKAHKRVLELVVYCSS
jgi:hypothetical protein